MSLLKPCSSASTARASAGPVTSQTVMPRNEVSRCTGSRDRTAASPGTGSRPSRCNGQVSRAGTRSRRERSTLRRLVSARTPRRPWACPKLRTSHIADLLPYVVDGRLERSAAATSVRRSRAAATRHARGSGPRDVRPFPDGNGRGGLGERGFELGRRGAASSEGKTVAMVLSLLIRWALLAVAVVLAAWATPDVDLRRGPVSAMVVAALIALANVVAQLALRLLPTPDALVPMAVLTLVVNGVAVWTASAFTSRLDIDGVVAALTFALMVSVFSVALSALSTRFIGAAEPKRA